MKKYEVLLFDVDGTLLNFDAAERDGIEGLLKHFGVPVTCAGGVCCWVVG